MWPFKKKTKFDFDFTDIEEKEIKREYDQLLVDVENRKVVGITITMGDLTRPMVLRDLLYARPTDETGKKHIESILRRVKLGYIELI